MPRKKEKKIIMLKMLHLLIPQRSLNCGKGEYKPIKQMHITIKYDLWSELGMEIKLQMYRATRIEFYVTCTKQKIIED
jgi:hypothetical protein